MSVHQSFSMLKSAQLLDFPFSGVACLAEPAREPSQAHFGHEPICWLSSAGSAILS